MGYFDLIDQVEQFVVLDCVQFEKQSWQQRNRIKAPQGLQWLTVPVVFRGRLGQRIDEVEIRDGEFSKDHLRAVELNYRRSPHFEDYYPNLCAILQRYGTGQRLVDLSLELIRWLMQCLGMTTPLLLASEMNLQGKRTELLANISVALKANEYLSPLGSAGYLLAEIPIMSSNGIDVAFQRYQHPEYRQLFPPFQPFASVLDLLMNEGANALTILRSGRRAAFRPEELTANAAGEADER
jgi:hypothetical protein